MSFYTQPQTCPQQVDLSPLQPFLKKGESLTKEEIIQDVNGKIDEAVVQRLKLHEFDCIYKNASGSIYLL